MHPRVASSPCKPGRCAWNAAITARQRAQPAGPQADGSVAGRREDLGDEPRAAARLQSERQRLDDVLAATGAGIWEWNVATGEMRLCERWAAQLGRTLQSLGEPTVRNTWLALTHPDDLLASLARLERHFDGLSDRYEAEFRMRHADGSWVWVLARGTLKTRLPDGSPEWMLGTHVDISGVKRNEDQLRRTQAVLARVGEIASIGGYEACLGTGQIDLSAQARKILGLPAPARCGLRAALGLLDAHERRRLCRAVVKARRAGTSWQVEVAFRPRGAELRTLHITGQQDVHEGRPRMVGAVQDISERARDRRLLDAMLRRLQAANLAGGVGIWTHDFLSGDAYADPLLLGLLGLRQGESVPTFREAMAMVHTDDRPRVLAGYRHAIRHAGSHQDEFRIALPDGGTRVLHAAAIIERGADGRPQSVTGAVWDVTRPRMLEQEFAQHRALLQTTLNSISDTILTTDRHGAVQWMNAAAQLALRTAPDAPVSLPAPLEQDIRRCIASGQAVRSTAAMSLASGAETERRVEYVCSPTVQGARADAGAVVVMRDVTEQHRRSEAMRWQATHDSLTGLSNRAAFDSRLRHALARAREGAGAHALLYMDLDQFKLVNDACGHAVGDQLLQEVARMVMDSVRAADTVARLGGDEFAAILDGCTTEQAGRAAQGICDRLEDYRFECGGRRFRIGASIGLVPIDGRWQDAAEILKAADSACYAAKDAGRNRVHTWMESDQSLRDRSGEMQWAATLEQALDEDRFVLYAQRIAPLSKESTGLHIELLVRMRQHNGQIVPPGAFMPAAERYDLASRIDKRVIQRALAELQRLPSVEGIGMVCINLSGKSIGDPLFAEAVTELLRDVPLGLRQRLCMEITETSAITSLVHARALIDSLDALGVSVALDDFGAGASSFGYLRQLPVAWLKIDGQFVRDLLTDPLDMAAVKCFVEVARVTGLRTVAEFVESQDVLDELRRLGVDCAQGYLVHRPEPLADMLRRELMPRRGIEA